MSQVSGNELQVVVNGRCRDLKIGVRQHPAGRLQLGLESPAEFADHDRARELLGAGNTAEPSHVPWQWTASQDFGDRVGVEEEGHSVQRDRTARPRTSHFRQRPDQVFRAFPAADETRQARSPVPPRQKRHAVHADQSRDGLAVPRDDHGLAVLRLAETVSELSLRLRSGKLTRHVLFSNWSF